MPPNRRRVNDRTRSAAAIVRTTQLRQGLSEHVSRRIASNWLDWVIRQFEMNEPLPPRTVRALVKSIQSAADVAATAISELPMELHILLVPLSVTTNALDDPAQAMSKQVVAPGGFSDTGQIDDAFKGAVSRCLDSRSEEKYRSDGALL